MTQQSRKRSFGFPRAVLKFKFVIFSWSADVRQFCVALTSYLPSKLLMPSGFHQRANHREAVCADGTYGALWVPWISWGASVGKVPQWLMGGLLDGVHDAVSRILIPLIPSQHPVCHSLSPFIPPSPRDHDPGLWMGWERNRPLWQSLHFCGSQVLTQTHSLFPVGSKGMISLGTELWGLGEGVTWVKSSCSFYPLLCSRIHICMYIYILLELFYQTSGLAQRCSTKGDNLRYILQGLLNHSWASLRATAESTSWNQSLYACYLGV